MHNIIFERKCNTTISNPRKHCLNVHKYEHLRPSMYLIHITSTAHRSSTTIFATHCHITKNGTTVVTSNCCTTLSSNGTVKSRLYAYQLHLSYYQFKHSYLCKPFLIIEGNYFNYLDITDWFNSILAVIQHFCKGLGEHTTGYNDVIYVMGIKTKYLCQI